METIRRLIKLTKWFLLIFIKNPMFEIYCITQNNKNKKFYKRVLKEKLNKKETHLEKYYKKEIPKILWIYWDKGYEQAPDIVIKCVEQWKLLNPTWKINFLDNQNISNYIIPVAENSSLSIQKKTNLNRLRLLSKYGGVWADATCFCHRSLDEWLPLQGSSGFFTFKNPGPDRIIENWFIASSISNPLTVEWESLMTKYFSKLKTEHPSYFISYYIFQWAIKKSRNLSEIFNASNSLSAGPTFLMNSVLENTIDKQELYKQLDCGLPVSKLNWRSNYDKQDIDYLINQYKIH